MEKLEKLEHEIYNFAEKCELNIYYARTFGEVQGRLRALGLAYEQIEPITDLLTVLNYDAFIHGFVSAHAVNLIKDSAMRA